MQHWTIDLHLKSWGLRRIAGMVAEEVGAVEEELGSADNLFGTVKEELEAADILVETVDYFIDMLKK